MMNLFKVKNRGPDPVPLTEIVIQWPFEATSGKHLLYLIAVQVSKFPPYDEPCSVIVSFENLLTFIKVRYPVDHNIFSIFISPTCFTIYFYCKEKYLRVLFTL